MARAILPMRSMRRSREGTDACCPSPLLRGGLPRLHRHRTGGRLPAEFYAFSGARMGPLAGCCPFPAEEAHLSYPAGAMLTLLPVELFYRIVAMADLSALFALRRGPPSESPHEPLSLSPPPPEWRVSLVALTVTPPQSLREQGSSSIATCAAIYYGSTSSRAARGAP